jgi:hypothetical protein
MGSVEVLDAMRRPAGRRLDPLEHLRLEGRHLRNGLFDEVDLADGVLQARCPGEVLGHAIRKSDIDELAVLEVSRLG